MKKILQAFLFAVLSFSHFARANPDPQASGLTQRILNAIYATKIDIDAAGTERLYGGVINGEDTNYGHWACARVVSLVLNQAGVKISKNTAGVYEVEQALRNWQLISNYADVQAGDVMVYKSITNTSGDCTGGGNCHVVIATSPWQFYGNVGVTIPYVFNSGPMILPMYSLQMVGLEFKEAFRPAN